VAHKLVAGSPSRAPERFSRASPWSSSPTPSRSANNEHTWRYDPVLTSLVIPFGLVASATTTTATASTTTATAAATATATATAIARTASATTRITRGEWARYHHLTKRVTDRHHR
jgi:hypothetical protein